MNFVMRDPSRAVELADAVPRPTGVDGVYGTHALFERVVEGLTGLISRHREPDTEVLRFPPVINRAHIEKVGIPAQLPAPARRRLLPARRAKREIRGAADRRRRTADGRRR